MEYIKAEEFLKQSKEIQKVFINWWKCDFGDLYVDNREYERDKTYCDINCVNMNLEGDIEGDWEYFKTISTPIFTEGQLRQFIEDKGYGMELQYYDDKSFTYSLYEFQEGTGKRNIAFEGTSLQAYWKVALQITKEEI